MRLLKRKQPPAWRQNETTEFTAGRISVWRPREICTGRMWTRQYNTLQSFPACRNSCKHPQAIYTTPLESKSVQYLIQLKVMVAEVQLLLTWIFKRHCVVRQVWQFACVKESLLGREIQWICLRPQDKSRFYSVSFLYWRQKTFLEWWAKWMWDKSVTLDSFDQWEARPPLSLPLLCGLGGSFISSRSQHQHPNGAKNTHTTALAHKCKGISLAALKIDCVMFLLKSIVLHSAS